MTLSVTGNSAGPTTLSAADDVLGLMTQKPEDSVWHSIAGLTAADGNTAFGVPFNVMAYFTMSNPSGGVISDSVTIVDAEMPYKVRVLKGKVTMLDEANGMLREAMNSCQVAVLTDDDSVASLDVSDMRQLEEKGMAMSRTGGEVIDTDGSLSVAVSGHLGETGVTDTLSFLVELTLVRVI